VSIGLETTGNVLFSQIFEKQGLLDSESLWEALFGQQMMHISLSLLLLVSRSGVC